MCRWFTIKQYHTANTRFVGARVRPVGRRIPGSEDDKRKYRAVLVRNVKAFSSSPLDVGNTSVVEHVISLHDERPVSAPYRRIAPALLKEVCEHLDLLLQKVFIVESKSSNASPIVVVSKKLGAMRLCCDYRALNARSVRDAQSLPRIQESLDSLSGS